MPVRLYSAIDEHDLDLHVIHVKDGSRIGYVKVCKSEGEPVPDDEIKKGYESDGKIVLLEDEDFEAARRRGLAGSVWSAISLEWWCSGWSGSSSSRRRTVSIQTRPSAWTERSRSSSDNRTDRSFWGSRARTDGIRHLLMVRRPLPADLSQTRQKPVPRRQAQVPLARWSALRAVPEELVVQRPPSARWSSAFVILERPRMCVPALPRRAEPSYVRAVRGGDFGSRLGARTRCGARQTRRFASLAVPRAFLVDRPGRDLLSRVLGRSAAIERLLDALVLTAPFEPSHHVVASSPPPVVVGRYPSRRRANAKRALRPWRTRAATRVAIAQRSDHADHHPEEPGMREQTDLEVHAKRPHNERAGEEQSRRQRQYLHDLVRPLFRPRDHDVERADDAVAAVAGGLDNVLELPPEDSRIAPCGPPS